MLKTVLNDPSPKPAHLPRIIPRAEHTVSRSHLSPNALRVLYRLKDAGYQAFLVGGCVRDLLIGREPKDFDVATDALPDEVRQLFRNCRLVGRRFRLAHVVFGREVIEVATFRASSAPPPGAEPLTEENEDGEEVDVTELEPMAADVDDSDIPSQDHTIHRVQNDRGRILRDNVYGTVDEDVWRRDFTANALYYNIADFSIWDYTNGAADVTARRLRLIGDPETRYREDPVRMLRAARFEAKLGFDLAPETAEPITRLRGLMADVPAARLFDETLKLFLAGHGLQSFNVLKARGLIEALLPATGRYLARYPGGAVERLMQQGLRNTDERVLIDKPVTPTFLFALLLYGPIALAIEALPPQRWHEPAAILDACDRVMREAQQRVSLPKRFALALRDMFALQPRLEQPRGRRALRLLEQPRFRAAYDLLLLRAGVGLAPVEVAQWWTRLQEASPEEQAQLCEHLPAGAETGAEVQGTAAAAPRRRRRRRR